MNIFEERDWLDPLLIFFVSLFVFSFIIFFF